MATPITQPCPKCGKVLDAHTEAGEKAQGQDEDFVGAPPFDASICAYCFAFLAVNEAGRFRIMTVGEELSLPTTMHQVLTKAREYLQDFHRRGKLKS